LLSEASNLDLSLLVFIFKKCELVKELFTLGLACVEVFHIGLKTIKDLDLDEFFETLIVFWLCLKLDVSFFRDDEIVL
jgi:hypothetical protein